jgi:FMN phosphatase YigB (HAD superfamily)
MTHIYIDLDNTLTNFTQAVTNLGEEAAAGLADDAPQEQKQKMYDAIEDAGVDFWAKMKWRDDGRDLWKLVQPWNPVLLSSPGLFRYAEEGKNAWVSDNIPGTSLFLSDNKCEYVDPYETSILIDDNKDNIGAWEEAGGLGILHVSTENTEKILLDLLWDRPDFSEKYDNLNKGKK